MSLAYSIPARLYPTVIVCLPIAMAVLAWFPDQLAAWGLLSAAGTTTLVAALTMLFSQLGRDAGKLKEPDLWQTWGGKPTTQLLRHRDRHLDDNTKRRYHARLGELVGVSLPSVEQEQQNPGAADDAYDSCVRWLIAHTRDIKQFPVLFKENVSYGFRRNLWGMRATGFLLAALGVGAAMLPLLMHYSEGFRVTAGVAIAVNATLLVLWSVRFTPDWIRIPAYRYAEELLLTVDVLNPAP